MRSLAENLKKAKENKKGFTLVEIIVVLVIIGILASLMLGALNGYIDKAKEKTLTANTRSIYLSAQLHSLYQNQHLDFALRLKAPVPVLAANTVGSEVYSGKTAYRQIGRASCRERV